MKRAPILITLTMLACLLVAIGVWPGMAAGAANSRLERRGWKIDGTAPAVASVGPFGPAHESLALVAIQQAKLSATDGGKFFGRTVAISGDTALVAARNDKVYVFVRSGSSWSQQAQLAPSDGSWNVEFGYDVALDGDVALIGTTCDYREDDSTSAWGSAYVFVRSGSTWTQQAKLAPSNPDEYFGNSVALSGDTALVGSPQDWDAAYEQSQGAAYVFVRSGSSWSQQDRLLANDAAPYDLFGWDVALSGDTALVGTNSTAGGSKEAAYVFVRSGGSWSQQAKLTESNGAAGDGFGNSVAVDGGTALVGSPRGDYDGSAYVFQRSGTAWSQQAKLVRGSAFRLGVAVALSGDTALVGSDSDAAFAFTRSGSAWSGPVALTTSDSLDNRNGLGNSVALDGDTALSGDFDDGNSAYVYTGAVYVFNLSEGSTDTTPPTTTDNADALWHATPVTVTFTATDNAGGSGVAYTEYKLDGAAWTHGTSVTVPAPPATKTTHTILYRSADTAGNVEADKSCQVKIDTTAPAPPTITTVTPISGPVGTTVTLTGTNFSGATKVAFHGTTAVFSVNSATKITATVPSSATTGTITVTTPGGTGTSATSFTVTAPVFTPTLTLKLSGLKRGVLTLGKRVTAKGKATPTSLAGSKVTLTVQKKNGTRWVKVKSAARTLSATGTYSWKYKPAKKGAYRMKATIAKTAAHKAAKTPWRAFKVK